MVIYLLTKSHEIIKIALTSWLNDKFLFKFKKQNFEYALQILCAYLAAILYTDFSEVWWRPKFV